MIKKRYLNSSGRFLAVSLVVLLFMTGTITACQDNDNQEARVEADLEEEAFLTTPSIGEARNPGKTEETNKADETNKSDETNNNVVAREGEKEMTDFKTLFSKITPEKALKGFRDENPIMTQRFGADPYAMVYEDRVYFYMTADTPSYDSLGNVVENTYGNIHTISVVSTEDMVNFTDHGEIPVAGKDGAAKWANNSWAPAAAWKIIDGKPKFFLYFADAGGGIGVLSADSPVGPFQDELGHGLITRDMPNCGNVLWLFDPAVLVDDDGSAYIYFGGGVPQDRISDPGTGRVAKLGEDMMSIEGEPVVIDAPYLFEDSGIHKYKDTYYYTYCSNWQVDEAGTQKYGFCNAEIVCLESKSPMGPFTFKEVILQNPGQVFGLYGNNHHCVFSFQDQWYITYHTRLLEQKMGMEKGYRCTHIDAFTMGEDGTIGKIKQSYGDRESIKPLSLDEKTDAATMSLCAGVETRPDTAPGKMILTGIHSGAYIKLSNVDFGEEGKEALMITLSSLKSGGAIRATVDVLNGEGTGYLAVPDKTEGFTECRMEFEKAVTGIHDLYLTFCGEDYEISDLQLVK